MGIGRLIKSLKVLQDAKVQDNIKKIQSDGKVMAILSKMNRRARRKYVRGIM